MTNDELISKCAPLIRELADSLGASITIGYRLPDEFIPRAQYSAHVGDNAFGYGFADTPFVALTAALADFERGKAERELKAEIEAEFQARMSRKAA